MDRVGRPPGFGALEYVVEHRGPPCQDFSNELIKLQLPCGICSATTGAAAALCRSRELIAEKTWFLFVACPAHHLPGMHGVILPLRDCWGSVALDCKANWSFVRAPGEICSIPPVQTSLSDSVRDPWKFFAKRWISCLLRGCYTIVKFSYASTQ